MKNPLIFCCLVLFALTACKQQEVKNDNPFFAEFDTPFGVPPFDLIKIEHYMPAIEEGMKQEKAEIEAILNNTDPPTFENTIVAYTRTGSFLGKVTPVLYHLNSENTTIKHLQSNENDDKISFKLEFKFTIKNDLKYLADENIIFSYKNLQTKEIIIQRKITLKLLPKGYFTDL